MTAALRKGRVVAHGRGEAVLGIDFGTSNSAAAVIGADGQPRALPLDGPSTSLPTALFFSQEDPRTFYGGEAMRQYLSGTEGRLMRSIKSLLGSALMDEQTLVNGRMVDLFDVVVMFLQELKRRAEAALGAPVHAAMLGRPVHFVDDDPVRDALAQATLKRAAHGAGFERVAFELEPIAAAFDFERSVRTDTAVLVVDVGGGTSDFTVVRTTPGGRGGADRACDILATGGVHLGGTDFDRLIDLDAVMPLLGRGHRGPSGREVPSPLYFDLSTWHLIQRCYSRTSLHRAADLHGNFTDPALHRRLLAVLHGRHGHRLLAAVEQAKIDCSQTGDARAIDLSAAERGLSTELTASTLARMLASPIGRIVQAARDCLAQSGRPAPDAIYLTGGSSLLAPLVVALQAAFPASTLVGSDRFASVAAGLALAGHNCVFHQN